MRPRSLTAVAVAAVSLLAPASALAAWSAPEPISLGAPGNDTADVQLATAPTGEAVLSWKEGSNIVRSAIRPAGGAFGGSETLDGNTGGAAPVPHVAIGPDGQATVVWFSNLGGRKLRYADRGAGAALFGSAQELFVPTEDVGSLDIVRDTTGATHVVFNGPGGSPYPAVWATTRPAAGAFGVPGAITGNLTFGAPGKLVLGTASDGHSILTWYEPSAEVAPGSQAQFINGGIRAAGDAGWTIGTVPDPPNPLHNHFFCCLSLGPQGVAGLVMDAAGNSYFTVNGVNDQNPTVEDRMPGPNFVRVSSAGVPTYREQMDPTWSNSGLGGTAGGDPQVAVDPAGNAWVAWAKEVEGKMRLFVAFRPTGEATVFGAAQEITANLDPGGFTGAFRIAARAAGAVLAWREACAAGSCELTSATSAPGSGAFTATGTVATQVKNGQGLQLSALAGDRVLAVWRENGGGLQASEYTSPAPPTPPLPTEGTPPATASTPPPAQCKVPKLVGKSLTQAKAALQKAHCALGKVTKPKARKGAGRKPLVVKASTPKAGASLPLDAKVAVRLGVKPRKRRN